MYNSGKILGGIIVFLVLVSSPIWYDLTFGQPDYMPNPVIVTSETECVRPVEYMRSAHMDLLNNWRDEVVRDGDRFYTRPDGRIFEKSLTNTCLNCHPNKDEFCDKCHSFSAVDELYCWDCHIVPEEVK